MSWDPYAALGLPKGSDGDAVKKAYRKMAKECHPDVCPNDPAAEEKFKRATAAFNLLSDPKQKARYDRGEIDADGQEQTRFHGNPFGGGSPFGGGGGARPEFRTHSYGHGRAEPGMDTFEDLFGNIFGGHSARGEQRRHSAKGQDVRYKVDVDFMDAVTGAKRRLAMTDGKVLDVNIPAGVETGQKLRLRSQGHPGVGGAPPGDALLEVEVKPSTVWERDGKDLRMKVPVDLKTAILGGSVEVKTPSGPVTLKVPAGSNTGSQLRLRGKGVQTSTPGNLYARLEIVLDDPKDDGLKAWAESH